VDQELRADGIGMRLGRLLSTNVLVEDFESMNWVVQHIEAAAQREALEADIDPTCPVEQVGGSLHVGRKADSEGDNTAQSHTIEAEEGDMVVVEEHLPRYTAVGHIQGRGAEEVGVQAEALGEEAAHTHSDAADTAAHTRQKLRELDGEAEEVRRDTGGSAFLGWR